MKVIKASFWNYKGLRKNGRNGGFSVKLDAGNNIFAIVGENGSGKTTLIENLNPFVLPNNYSGKKLEFVDLPGGKEIEWVLGENHYLSKIEFSEQGWTKAKLFLVGAEGKKEIVPGFESGKATTYTSLIENMLVSTHKNISRVNFVGQGTSALINAKPGERKEMIGNMVDDTSIHEQVFADYKEKAESKKEDILSSKGAVDGLIVQVKSIGKDGLVEQVVVDGLENEVAGSRKNIGLLDDAIKSANDSKEVIVKDLAKADESNKKMLEIKADDKYDNFPNKIELIGDGSEDVLKRKKIILENNNKSEKKKLLLDEQINKAKGSIEAAKAVNVQIKDEWNFDLLGKQENVGVAGVEEKQKQLEKDKIDAEDKQKKFYINNEKKKSLEDAKLSLSGLTGNIDTIKSEIIEGHKSLFKLDKTLSEEVEVFIGAVVEHFGSEHLRSIEGIAETSFGVMGIASSEEEKNKTKTEINKNIGEFELLVKGLESDVSVKERMKSIESNIVDGLENQEDELMSLANKQKELFAEMEEEKRVIKVLAMKDKYSANEKFVESEMLVIDGLVKELEGISLVDVTDIDKELELGYENDKKLVANKYRQRYVELDELSERKADLEAQLDKLNTDLKEHMADKVVNGGSLKLIEQQWSDAVIGNNKRVQLESLQNQLDRAEDNLKELKVEEKTYNEIKLYAKNIKETIISSFMVNITNLANQYLASDSHSSIKMTLSIEQKGGNFNIRAKQENMDFQEVNTLSGAESATVNRALGMAIAFSDKHSKYGLYAFDEADSALSETNKKAFIENIMDISQNEKVDQLLLISQDSEVVDEIGATKIEMGLGK